MQTCIHTLIHTHTHTHTHTFTHTHTHTHTHTRTHTRTHTHTHTHAHIHTHTHTHTHTQLKDFVKHNKVEGWVEVELFNSRGKNWVVRRLLSTDANTSSWMLNGKEVLKKEVGLYPVAYPGGGGSGCSNTPSASTSLIIHYSQSTYNSLHDTAQPAAAPSEKTITGAASSRYALEVDQTSERSAGLRSIRYV